MSDLQLISLTLIFSGFFSGMEIAFVSSNRLKIELDLKKKNKFSAKLLNPFYKTPSRFIGALLLGNNIALVIYGIAMAKLLQPAIVQLLPTAILNDFSVLLTQTLLSTLLILIVAEFFAQNIFFVSTPTPLSMRLRFLYGYFIICCIPLLFYISDWLS